MGSDVLALVGGVEIPVEDGDISAAMIAAGLDPGRFGPGEPVYGSYGSVRYTRWEVRQVSDDNEFVGEVVATRTRTNPFVR